MRPLVSVITPTYNGADFVEEAIRSVLEQTHDRVEHILVDDGSTDGTPELLAAAAERHPDRICVIAARGRAGPCRRRNDALAASKGELIAWLDQDDIFASAKLELQVDALAAAPGAAFAFSQYEEFDHETGRTTFASSLRGGDDLLHRLFVEGCFIAASTVVFRRAAFVRRSTRLYDRHFSFGDDYFLWLSLLLDARAVLVDQPLVRLRRHSRNESARLGSSNFHVLRLAVLGEFLEAFPDAGERLGRGSIREGLSRHAIAAAAWELEHGSRLQAARYAARAAARDPVRTGRVVQRVARASSRRLLR
jgi:glycosyltransferase involved in cell wall biosynthesis